MKPGAVFVGILSVLGLGSVMAAFLMQASPYVNVAEAKAKTSDGLHLIGDIEKGTMRYSTSTTSVHFVLKDKNGDSIPVVYKGPPPANMGSATQVVAVGGVKQDAFHAEKLILKCPTKYEAKETQVQ